MKPHEIHRSAAPTLIVVEVVTVSTSRYRKMRAGESFVDESGDMAEKECKAAGLKVLRRTLVSDDAEMITKEVKSFLSGETDVLMFTGGTGISKNDITIETVEGFFDKEIDGFGELLRRSSYPHLGAASALTRATAGVVSGRLILCMPGSPDAVRTALRSFAREIPHAIMVARS
jgi:molybdenum cofactor biosynthesis protein B